MEKQTFSIQKPIAHGSTAVITNKMETKTMREKTQTFFGMTGPAFARPPKLPYLDPTREKGVKRCGRSFWYTVYRSI